MPFGERSLAQRVGWTAAGTSFGAALATLVIAMLVVDHLERSEARAESLALAQAIARELDFTGPQDREGLEAEVREFTHGGFSIAIFGRAGQRLAGVPGLPAPETSPCAVGVSDDTQWLVCEGYATDRRRVLVGQTTESLLAHRAPLLLGGAIALVVVVLASVLAGLFVGRWSLAPLARLEAAVARVDATHPETHQGFEHAGLREVDAVAKALDDLLARLSAELSRSRRFSADAAHELRTPLSKLRAEVELVAEELPGGSTQRAALLRAVLRTGDLTGLIDRLLLLASPEDAIRSATLTSLAVVLETAVEDLDTGTAERIRLALADDGHVLGDETVLRSVVANALDNALKYSDGDVRVHLSQTEAEVLLRVDDDGPGLDAEARKQAFEPFYRGPRQRGQPGHGVGLALIAHVVSAHGGSVRFLDQAPGAKLEIRLPKHGA